MHARGRRWERGRRLGFFDVLWRAAPPLLYIEEETWRRRNSTMVLFTHTHCSCVNSNPQVKPPLRSYLLFLRDLILSLGGQPHGPLGLGAWPMWASVPPPRSMWTPPGQVGPTRGPSEPSRTFPVQYRKNPELFRNPKNTFPYMILYLRTIPELLMASWIPSETLNKFSVSPY